MKTIKTSDTKEGRVGFFSSIRTKMIFAVMFIVSVLVVCACLIVDSQMNRINTEQFHRFMEQQLSVVAQNVRSVIQNAEHAVGSLADHPLIKGADGTLHNYSKKTKAVILKDIPKNKTERDLVPRAFVWEIRCAANIAPAVNEKYAVPIQIIVSGTEKTRDE